MSRFDGSVTAPMVVLGRLNTQGWWGNVWLNNNSQNVSPSFAWTAPTGTRRTHVTMFAGAESEGNVNQAVNYALEACTDNASWLALDAVVTHNLGGATRALGASLSGWLPMPVGGTLYLRMRVNVQGGGPRVLLSLTNANAHFFS